MRMVELVWSFHISSCCEGLVSCIHPFIKELTINSFERPVPWNISRLKLTCQTAWNDDDIKLCLLRAWPCTFSVMAPVNQYWCVEILPVIPCTYCGIPYQKTMCLKLKRPHTMFSQSLVRSP